MLLIFFQESTMSLSDCFVKACNLKDVEIITFIILVSKLDYNEW